MDKELEAIKTAIENYRCNTKTWWHQENAQKALDIAKQMIDWFEKQYKPYKEVIGAYTVNVWLGNESYHVSYGSSTHITGVYCDITGRDSVLTDIEIDAVKRFVANWQKVKDRVKTALAERNEQCLAKEQRLRNTELETQELFDGFEV